MPNSPYGPDCSNTKYNFPGINIPLFSKSYTARGSTEPRGPDVPAGPHDTAGADTAGVTLLPGVGGVQQGQGRNLGVQGGEEFQTIPSSV